MRKYTYTGNRGMDLESFITYASRRYRTLGIAVIEKQHTHFTPLWDRKTKRIVSCKVEEKATVDYMGRVGSTPIAFEAKSTQNDRIRYDEVENHQAEFLDDFTADCNGIGFVLVSFNLNTFYMIPWQFWKTARNAWKEAQRKGKRKANIYSVTFEGQEWITNGMASVKESELLPEWEVKMDGKVGLDYLRRYL